MSYPDILAEVRSILAALENRIDLDRFNPSLSMEIDSLVTQLEDS